MNLHVTSVHEFRLLYSEPMECQEHKKSGCVPFHDAAKNGDVETSK